MTQIKPQKNVLIDGFIVGGKYRLLLSILKIEYPNLGQMTLMNLVLEACISSHDGEI